MGEDKEWERIRNGRGSGMGEDKEWERIRNGRG